MNAENPIPIERAIAENYVKMGDVPHAVDIYRNAAGRTEEEGKLEEAVPLLEEIVRIAPEDEAAKSRLAHRVINTDFQ